MADGTKKLGLMGAVFLIVSSLAGSGIIALPQQLAATGSITLISFILVHHRSALSDPGLCSCGHSF